MIQDPYDWIPEARPYSSGQEAYTSSGDAERETLIALGEWDPAWDEEEKPTGLVEPGEKKTLDWSDAWDGGLGDIIGDMTPFVAGVKELAEAKSLWEAADRVKNDTATPEDFQLIQAFMEEAGADKTVGYHINSILRQLPAFAVELWAGVGVARLGAKGAAKLGIEAIQTGLEKTIKDRALRSTARKLTSQATALEASGEVAEGAMKRKAAEGLMKTIVKDSPVKAITEAGKLATASTIGSEAVTSVAGGLAGQGWGGRSQADAYRRAFQKAGITMKRDEAGRLALDFAGELETFWDSLPAGIANTFVEHVSERMGGTLMRLPIINRLEGLQSAVAARFMGKHKMKPAELMEFLDKFGWDGPIEEYMEERAAGWTRGIFFKGEDEWYIGEDEDGYYFKTEMLFPDWKQHAGELAAFAIAGQGASSLHGYFAGDKDPMARVRGARTLAEVETGVLRKTFEQKLTEAKDENGIPLGPVAVEALRSGQAGMEDYDRIAKVINAPGNEGVAEAATDAGIRGFRPEGPTVLPTVETEAAKWAGTFGDKDVPGKVVGPSTAYQRQLKEQFADYVDIVFVEGGPKFDSTATGHWSGATEGGQHVRGTVYMNAGLREDQPGGALTLLSKVFHEATHDYQWLNDRHKKVALDALFEGNNSLVESTRLDYFTPFILNETVQTVKEEGVEGEEGWKKETTDELWSPDFLTLDREGRLKEVERYKKEIWDPKRKDPRKEEQEEMEAQLAENYADVLEFLHLQNGAEYIEKLKKRSPRTIERLRDWFAFKVNRFRSENDQLPTGEAARMERLSQQLTGLKDSTETFKIASTFKDAMSVLGGPLGRRKGLVAAPPEEGAKPTEQAEPSPEIQQIAEEFQPTEELVEELQPTEEEIKQMEMDERRSIQNRSAELEDLSSKDLTQMMRDLEVEGRSGMRSKKAMARAIAKTEYDAETEAMYEASQEEPAQEPVEEAPVGEAQTELTWPEIRELSDRPFDFEELQAVQEIIATGKPGKKQIGDVELSVTNAGVWTKRGNRASVFLSNEEFEGTYPPDVGWLSPVKLAKEGGDLEGKNVADLKHIAASLNLPISSRFTVDGVALGQKKDGTPKRRTLRMDELRRSIKARREELEGDDSDLPTREAAPQYKTLSDLSREEREEVLRHAEEIGTSGIPEMNKADISRENAEQWGISPEEMHGLYIDSTPQRIRAVTPRRAKILDDALKLTNEGRGHMNLADISDETADDWSITAQEMHNLFFAAEEAHRLVAQGRSPMNLADIVGETAHDLEEFGVSQEEVGHLLFGAHDLANPVTREAAPQVVYTDAKRRPAGRKDLGAAWYIPNEDKIYVNRVAARKKYEEKAWTKPKLEGVTALPEDAFGSYEEWEQWLIDHESYHAKEPREGQFPANAAFENRANEYATLTGLERAGRWAETKQMRSEILERERAQRPKLAGGAPEARREPVEPRYVEGVKPRQLIGPRMPHEGPGREERVAEERVLGIAGREELPEEEPQFVKTVPAVPLTEAQYAPIAEAQRKQEEMYEQLGGETGKGLGLRKEYIGRPGLRKVISGGQTGADRISLEAAKGRYVTGGTAPKGFRTSRGDDPSLAEFGLEEHESRDWLPRTEVNVQNSDGTLVLGDPTKPGSAKTIGFSKKHRKPFIINPTVGEFKKWIEENDIRTLNGAGNRTYEDAEYVEKLLEAVHDPLLAEEDAELQAVLDADRAALKKDREQVEARRKQVRTELFSEIFPEGFDDAVLDGYHIIGVSREGGEHQIVEHLVGPEDTPQEAAEKAIGVPFLHGPGIGMAPSEAEHLRGALSDKDKLIYENAAQDAHEQSYEPYVTFREFEVDQKDRRRGNELWEDDLSFKQKGTYRDLKRTVSNLIAGASPLSRKIVPQETKVPMEEGGKWLPFETAFARYVNALNELRYLQENYDQPIYQRTGKWGIGQKQEAGFRKIASQQQRLIDEAKSERHEELERDVSEGDLQPFGYGRVGAELASGELAKPSQIPFKGRAPGKISDVDERGRIVEGKVGSYTTEEVDQLAHQMKLDRGEQKRIKNRKSTAAGKRIDPGAERLNEEGPVEAVIERAVSRIAKMKQEIDSGETTSWRLVGRMGVEKATMQAANRDLLVVKGTTLERLNMTPHAKGVHRLSPKQDEAFESEEFSAEGAEAALEKLRSEFAGRPTVLAAGLGTATKEEIDKEQDEWDTRLETELIDKTLLQDVAEEQEAAYEARGQQPADIDLVQMKAQQEGRWQPEVLEDPFNYKSWMKIPEAEGGGLTTQEVKTPSTSGSFSPETLPGDVEDPGKVLGLLELSPDAVDTVKSRREPTTLSGSFERYKGDGIYTLPEGTQVFLQQIAPESYTLEPIGLRARAEDFGGAEPAKHLRPVSVTDAEERMRPDVRSYETQASPPPPSPFRAHPRPRPVRTFYAKLSHFKDWDYVNNRPYPRFETTGEVTSVRVRREAKEEAKVFLSPLLNGLDGTAHEAAQAYIKADNAANLVVEALVNDMQENREAKLQAALDLDEGDPRSIEVSRLRRLDEQARETLIREPSAGRIPAGYKRHAALVYGNQGIGKYLMLRPELTMPGKPGLSGIFSPQYLETLAKGKREPTLNDLMAGLKALEESAKQRARIAREALSPEWIGAKFGVGSGLIQTAQQQAWRYTYVVHGEGIRSGNVPVGELISVFADEGGMAMFDGKRAIPVDPEMASSIAEVLEGHNTPDMKRFDLLQRVATSSGIMRLTEGEATRLGELGYNLRPLDGALDRHFTKETWLSATSYGSAGSNREYFLRNPQDVEVYLAALHAELSHEEMVEKFGHDIFTLSQNERFISTIRRLEAEDLAFANYVLGHFVTKLVADPELIGGQLVGEYLPGRPIPFVEPDLTVTARVNFVAKSLFSNRENSLGMGIEAAEIALPPQEQRRRMRFFARTGKGFRAGRPRGLRETRVDPALPGWKPGKAPKEQPSIVDRYDPNVVGAAAQVRAPVDEYEEEAAVFYPADFEPGPGVSRESAPQIGLTQAQYDGLTAPFANVFGKKGTLRGDAELSQFGPGPCQFCQDELGKRARELGITPAGLGDLRVQAPTPGDYLGGELREGQGGTIQHWVFKFKTDKGVFFVDDPQIHLAEWAEDVAEPEPQFDEEGTPEYPWNHEYYSGKFDAFKVRSLKDNFEPKIYPLTREGLAEAYGEENAEGNLPDTLKKFNKPPKPEQGTFGFTREAAPQMSPFARRVLTGDQLSDYTNWKKLGEKMVNRYLPFTDWERVLEGQKDPETGQYIEIPRSMRLSLRQAMKRGELSYKQAEIEKRLFKPLQDVILNRRSGRKKLGFGQEMTFKDAETLSKMLAVQEKHNVLLGRQPKEREGLPVGMRPAGIDPYEAKKEINKLTKRYGKEHVAALEKAVMAISAETRKIWGRAELVSAPVLAFLAKSYPHYVPYSEHEMQELQEWKEMYDPDVLRMNDVAKNMDKFVKTLGSDAMMATDRGSDMRQPMFRTALGMTSETKDSPLLMLMAQLNHALDKELDAQISHSVIDLIKLGQEHGVYNIATIVPESERTYQRLVVRKDRPDEAARGLATDVRNPDFADNPLVYVAAGVDGARTIIEFHPNYAQIPLALKNENMPKGSIINALDYAKALTRFISAMITRWNPMFSVPNFVRDTTTASAHMTAEYGPKIAAEMFLRPSLLGSIKTLMKANYAIANGTYDADAPEFADDPDMVLFERYRASGAPVTFLDLGKTRGLEDWFKEIHQYHNPSEVHQLQFWKGKASALVGYVENFNDAFENAARFAYFKYGIEKGLPSKLVEGENMDDQELGFGAKNLTVNFEARGTIGGLFNSLYMFANANIQSNARLIDAIFSRDREGKRSFQPHAKSLVGGIVTLHAAVAIMNAAIGGTDPDDDETYWAKIPDWDKRANLILLNWMGQDGKGIKIPLPYGYNFFAAIGNMFGEVWSGTKTKDEVSPYLFETALQAFSPVGGGTDITDMVTPTVAKPFFEVRNNRDWKGSAIYKNRYGNDSIPDSELAFDSVDKDVQALTDWLNEAAGGNKYRSGKFLGIDMSINPATIEHMAQFLGGGIGKEGIRAKKVYEQISEGEEVAVGDVPLLRRFALAPTKYSAASLYRERRKEIIQVENMWKAGMDLSEEDRRLIGLSSAKRHAETSIKRIRERRRLYDRDSEEYKRSEERERSVQNAFNKRWNKIMKATASS